MEKKWREWVRYISNILVNISNILGVQGRNLGYPALHHVSTQVLHKILLGPTGWPSNLVLLAALLASHELIPCLVAGFDRNTINHASVTHQAEHSEHGSHFSGYRGFGCTSGNKGYYLG